MLLIKTHSTSFFSYSYFKHLQKGRLHPNKIFGLLFFFITEFNVYTLFKGIPLSFFFFLWFPETSKDVAVLFRTSPTQIFLDGSFERSSETCFHGKNKKKSFQCVMPQTKCQNIAFVLC